MSNPAGFWPEALPWAQEAHAQTGVLTSVILAQWAIETLYGGTDWSPNNNPGNVGSFDGQPVNKFPTLAEGVAAYIQLMNAPDRPEFGATIRKAATYQEQAYLLGAANPVWASARYALPGGAPGSEITSIIGTYGLTKYDGASPTPTPTPTPTPAPVPSFPKEKNMLTKNYGGAGYYGVRPNASVYTFEGADYIGPHATWAAAWGIGTASNPITGIASDGAGGFALLADGADPSQPHIYDIPADGRYAQPKPA